MTGKLFQLISQAWQYWQQNGTAASWQAFCSQEAHPLLQFIKYGICGVGATVVHNAIVVGAGLSFLPAFGETELSDQARQKNLVLCNLLAFPFSNFFAYFFNALWVFTPGRHSKLVEFGLFTAVSALSTFIALLGGPLLIARFGLPSWVAQLGFLFSSVIVNFICRKFFVFQK